MQCRILFSTNSIQFLLCHSTKHSFPGPVFVLFQCILLYSLVLLGRGEMKDERQYNAVGYYFLSYKWFLLCLGPKHVLLGPDFEVSLSTLIFFCIGLEMVGWGHT